MFYIKGDDNKIFGWHVAKSSNQWLCNGPGTQGSILAFSGAVESAGRQMKQGWIKKLKNRQSWLCANTAKKKKKFERAFSQPPIPPLSRGLRDSEKHLLHLMTKSLQLYKLKFILLLLFSLSFRSPKCWSVLVQVSHSFICILHLMIQSVKLDKLKFILLLLFSPSFRSPKCWSAILYWCR